MRESSTIGLDLLMLRMFVLGGCLWILMIPLTLAQPPAYHFSKLTVDDGLNDGIVRAICQDKYGYLWFASIGGLNRYNGYTMEFFSHIPVDTTSPLGSLVECMSLDKSGRLWIGFESGLMEYDYTSGRFRKIPALADIWVNTMLAANDSVLYLGTQQGLVRFNTYTELAEIFSPYDASEAFSGHRVYNLALHGDLLYMGRQRGVSVFNTMTNEVSRLELPLMDAAAVRNIVIDGDGDLWLGSFADPQLMRFRPADSSYESYRESLTTEPFTTVNNITGIYLDYNNNLWVTTTVDGLLEYLPSTNTFRKHLHIPLLTTSPGSDLHRSFFQDKDGTIWLGGNHGVNYFNPSRIMFQVIMPFDSDLDTRSRRIARGVAEDLDGRFWFTTLDGVVRYDPETQYYRTWRNEGNTKQVYYNSVRAVTVDSLNRVWIATGAGINRYDPQGDLMEFIPHGDLPLAFYFSATQDKQGRIWFGSRDWDGFYYYDTRKNTYHSIKAVPGLEPLAGLGGRYFLEDSKGRFWLGFNGNGLGMFDPASGKIVRWTSDLPAGKAIPGNLIIDIKEDLGGIIWISTHNGIAGIDYGKDTVVTFNVLNGLASNTASSLGVDSLNRLWVATTRGICMIDTSRTHVTAFDTKDGLPISEFPEHPGYICRDGSFMFPSNNGYVRFNPMSYLPDTSTLKCYVSGVRVLNQPYPIAGEMNELSDLRFNHNQSSFTLSFAAINYTDQHKTWYAYRLDGFETEWHYTQNREANYTNVPGGSYRFLLKATKDTHNWNTVVTEVGIDIGTVFYKTWWFIGIAIVVLTTLVLLVYRYRMKQHQQVSLLSTRSQQLEKEKAIVMYESLKQQLNPHFLFNSLTSLRSLIRSKPEAAGDFLDGLSRTYRYILSNRDNVTVSLISEVKFAETFVSLQKARFPRGFDVNFRIDEDQYERKIVPVTLQNLVENAIKHNLIDQDSPLVIEIYTEDEYLVVRNTLQLKEFVETSNKQGLGNLKSLYKYLTDIPIEIVDTGSFFEIKIPLL